MAKIRKNVFIDGIVHYATREERASFSPSVKFAARAKRGQQITRGENGRPPEKHTILFFRPIIVNIIIVKKLWLGKKIVQWWRLVGVQGRSSGGAEGGEAPSQAVRGAEPPDTQMNNFNV